MALHGVWGTSVTISDTVFSSCKALDAGVRFCARVLSSHRLIALCVLQGAISTITTMPSSDQNSLFVYGCAFTANTQGNVDGVVVSSGTCVGLIQLWLHVKY